MEKIPNGLRFIYRTSFFVLIISCYFVTSSLIFWSNKDSKKRRSKLSQHSNKYAKAICALLNIKIEIKNPIAPDTRGLVVGNHMGFVDIFAVHSILPSLFVTSLEMRETPVLGPITEFGGCLYVNRKNRANILMELKEMIMALRDHDRVIIYPEATSHNGEEVLPFKRTLLTAAAHASVPIIPYCFNFLSIDGKPFSLQNRDAVCWYGDILFITAAVKLLQTQEIRCQIEFLDFVYPSPDDDRGLVADKVRQKIVEKFIPALK